MTLRIRASSSLAAMALAVALGGCSTATPSSQPTVQTICLPMPAYSLADQQLFAREAAALDPVKDDQVIRFLGDYKAMRDADRACLASKH